MLSKPELRKIIKQEKSQNTARLAKLSSEVCQKLETTKQWQAAQTVVLYYSLSDEVNTEKLLNNWFSLKDILLPCIENDDIVLRKYDGRKSLNLNGKYNIPEPTGLVFNDYNKIDLIAVPGVAFDKENYRMGRGKGYYDRFLPKTDAYKIGICFPFQYFDFIPTEPHDVPMDMVIC